MRAIFSMLTLAAFQLHMWLGCCAHHVHGATDQQPGPAAVGCSHPGHAHSHAACHAESGQLSDNRTASAGDAPRHSGGSHDDGHESHCHVLAVGKITLQVDPSSGWLAATARDVGCYLAVGATASDWLTGTAHLCWLPVRLHLFEQVLRI